MAIVKQAEGKPEVPAEVIAQSIERIGAATAVLLRSGLNLKAILILLSASSGESRRTCENVLHAMNTLRSTYLAPKKVATK